MRAAREVSSAMMLSRSRAPSLMSPLASNRCDWPRIVVSGLLISWATPEASSPTAESFSARMSWAWVSFSSSICRWLSE